MNERKELTPEQAKMAEMAFQAEKYAEVVRQAKARQYEGDLQLNDDYDKAVGTGK